MSSSSTPGKHIVIIGGGAASIAIVREFEQKLPTPTSRRVTLITARPFFVHLPAVPRMVATAEGGLEQQALIPFEERLHIAKVKAERAIAVEPKQDGMGGVVILETGREIEYDVLILTPGCTWGEPFDFPLGEEEAEEHVAVWRRRLQNATSVAVVGGGSTGIGQYPTDPMYHSR